MKNKNKNKIAVSLAELIVALVITTFVTSLVFKTFTLSTDEITRIGFKNAIASFKLALENLTTNPMYYALNSDLSDTSTINIDGAVYGGETKFREILLKELNLNSEYAETCEILIGNEVSSQERCYVQDNGVVWGIPDTDFLAINLKRVESAQGTVSNYLPITIYTSEKAINKTGYFNENALILGVRKDGALTPITTVDCEQAGNKNLNQCRVEEFFTSSRYKR